MQSLATRTRKTTATFAFPFRLGRGAEEHPAGTYDVETEDAIYEGNGWNAYVRVATVMLIRTPGQTRYCTIEPAELSAALALDAERGGPGEAPDPGPPDPGQTD